MFVGYVQIVCFPMLPEIKIMKKKSAIYIQTFAIEWLKSNFSSRDIDLIFLGQTLKILISQNAKI